MASLLQQPSGQARLYGIPIVPVLTPKTLPISTRSSNSDVCLGDVWMNWGSCTALIDSSINWPCAYRFMNRRAWLVEASDDVKGSSEDAQDQDCDLETPRISTPKSIERDTCGGRDTITTLQIASQIQTGITQQPTVLFTSNSYRRKSNVSILCISNFCIYEVPWWPPISLRLPLLFFAPPTEISTL